MSVKIVLLQSGEQVITDIKEVISEEKSVAYLFTNPQKVTINKPFLVSEQDYKVDSLKSFREDGKDDQNIRPFRCCTY